MRKKYLIGLSLIVVIIVGGSVALNHSPRMATVAAFTTFLGYTNDPTEGRLARFRFSNAAPVSIERYYFYGIAFQTATGWVGQYTQSFPDHRTRHFRRTSYGPVLRPRESEVVAVSAPVTQNRWRLSFPYKEHENRLYVFAAETLHSLPGLWKYDLLTNYDRSKYWSDSNEVDP